jgi:hypothetical protein
MKITPSFSDFLKDDELSFSTLDLFNSIRKQAVANINDSLNETHL